MASRSGKLLQPTRGARPLTPNPMSRETRKRRLIIRTVVYGSLILGIGIPVSLLAWEVAAMPGQSHAGTLPPLGEAQHSAAARLKDTVTALVSIGERHTGRPEALNAARDRVDRALREATGRPTRWQTFPVHDVDCSNIVVELPGTRYPDEIVVVGAHYDTAEGTPGANDNGSGTAALVELAARLSKAPHDRTLRLVAFVNEEPPHFQTSDMGSNLAAYESRQAGENIIGMLSLETMGYFTDAKGSQAYPSFISLLYPSTGNFIAFVGNKASRTLVRTAVGAFRKSVEFPSEGAVLPGSLPGVGWSDHWAYWQAGYPALMVTDTAPFRYAHYHEATDTPERVDFERLARVVDGLEAVITNLLAHGVPDA